MEGGIRPRIPELFYYTSIFSGHSSVITLSFAEFIDIFNDRVGYASAFVTACLKYDFV